MRNATILLPALLLATLLAGCANPSQNGLPTGSQTVAPVRTAPDAVQAQRAVRPSIVHPAGRVPHDLYIADNSRGAILRLLGRTYRDNGFITSGVNVPVSVFLDRQGNLYVANQAGQDVTEYAPGTSAPSFTYSSGMPMPQVVTTDVHGNVYVGDYFNGLNEYYQGLNSPIATCSPGHGIYGIAVDSAGDVFVDTFNGAPVLIKYSPGGLGTCSGTVLAAAPAHVGAIGIDAKGNLLVCDANVVDEIPPPYSAIAGTLGSGFTSVSSVTLNKANTEAFVTDVAQNTVTVLSYPGGTNLTVLSTGADQPFAAVDWSNAVY